MVKEFGKVIGLCGYEIEPKLQEIIGGVAYEWYRDLDVDGQTDAGGVFRMIDVEAGRSEVTGLVHYPKWTAAFDYFKDKVRMARNAERSQTKPLDVPDEHWNAKQEIEIDCGDTGMLARRLEANEIGWCGIGTAAKHPHHTLTEEQVTTIYQNAVTIAMLLSVESADGFLYPWSRALLNIRDVVAEVELGTPRSRR